MGYRKFFIMMVLLVLMSSIAALVAPSLINIWIRDGGGITINQIFILFIVLIIALIFQLGLTFYREKFAKDFNIRNAKNMLLDFLNLNYDEIQDKGPTNFIERIAIAVNSYYEYFTECYINIWSSVLIVIVILGMIVFKNWIIALLLSLLIPVNYFGYKFLNKELMNRSKILQESTSSGWQEIISVAGQTDHLKQCSDYDMVISQFHPSLNKIYDSMANINIYAQVSSKVLSSVNQIAQVIIMAMVVYDFMINHLDPTALILYSIILPMYFSNMSIIVRSNLNKRDMKNSRAFISEMKANAEKTGTKTIDSINEVVIDIPMLEMKDKVLAKDINGTYHKGDIVWIRGDSGAGKSTLVKLIPKFRITDKILINGVDIREVSNKSLRSRVDYLSQNVPIIKGTLGDNLFFNKQYTKEQELQFINDPILQTILKDKAMNSLINENGTNLSGGERQKIAIARALYDDVDVLILDEVTSNIDKQSAADIYNRILQNHNNKIIFIISHDDLPGSITTHSLFLNKSVNS